MVMNDEAQSKVPSENMMSIPTCLLVQILVQSSTRKCCEAIFMPGCCAYKEGQTCVRLLCVIELDL